jgi:TPR repeat protein
VRGEKREYLKAAQWLARAADKGHVQAMLLLGQMSAVGEGTTRNMPEAYRHLLLASKHPDAEVFGIKNILTPLRTIEQSLTQQQIDDVQRP